MNPENQRFLDLRSLILKSQCDALSDSEIVQLNELIQSDGGSEEAAALIDQLCALTDSRSLDSLPMAKVLSEAFEHRAAAGAVSRASNVSVASNLSEKTSALTDSYSGQTDSVPSTLVSKLPWLVAIAASYLVVASLAWSIAKSSPEIERVMPIAQDSPDRSESDSVQLVSMTACVWRPSGDAVPTLGKSLQSGEVLSLLEGIAELRVGEEARSEALVRLEGPASVHIRPDGQLGLLHGSMTMKSLGTGSETVIVDTPIGLVLIDGQSSIGLVSNGSESEVHLFAGLALVKPHQALSAANNIHLENGEAVRISSKPGEELTVVKFEATEANFVSARSPGFDPLSLGDAYVSAIAESQPNIYWRFEELKGEAPHYVENHGSTPGMNAVVVGNPLWRQYGSNRVAELGVSTSSAFRALEPWPENPLEEYTIEMWVKPQLYHHGEVLCLHAIDALEDGRYPHTMMLEMTAQHYFTHRLSDSPANRFRFVHRALRSNEPISATSLFSEREYQARVWQHVVTQKKGSRQMLWIDGQLSAEHSNPAPLTDKVQILVGQVYPDSVYRRFVGQIDEVAIYDRCLTPMEMRKHIRAAGRRIAHKESVSLAQ
ncbi:MAG: LamG-like jellyroll fold domain-containing protein [Pirellulaceae bacterium]